MADPLTDVIYKAGPRADPAPIAAAVRALLAALLDAEEARWVRDPHSDALYVFPELRATLGIDR